MKISVVLVTYNRIDKLIKCLECYDKQKFIPKEIIVVNNNSCDGTREYLEKWSVNECNYNKVVINLEKNIGGSGGFYEGLNYYMKNSKDMDWVWVSDDDAFPQEDTFEEIYKYYKELEYNKRNNIVALCSKVINNGEIHYAHRNHIIKRLIKCPYTPSFNFEYNKKAFNIDVFSYVGTLIKRSALKKAGITNKDYFIYGDDQEHSLRLRKFGEIICIPSSEIIHNTPGFCEKKIFWGHYYNTRNDLINRKKYFNKKYYYLKIIKIYISEISFFSKNNKNVKTMFKCAINDARSDSLGIHPVYKPGYTL